MSQSQESQHEAVARRLSDTAGIQAALKRAARQAIEEHARAGLKIAVWRDGKVAWEDAKAHLPPPDSSAAGR
jgi:hypothetical protein